MIIWKEINDQLDVISERLIALEGSPYSTLQEFADHTGIKDEKGRWQCTIPERIEILVSGYRYLADLYQKGAKFREEKAMIAHKIFLLVLKLI